MKKSTTMLDFFKRKCSTSNSSEVNVELPTTNVTIPILENVDAPILENVHLQRVVNHFTTEQIANNQLQLKATVFIFRYLAFQAIAFRGRDESFSSLNHGKFLESLGIVTFWNEKVVEIIEKAPKNATYTSPRIQKEILYIYSF